MRRFGRFTVGPSVNHGLGIALAARLGPADNSGTTSSPATPAKQPKPLPAAIDGMRVSAFLGTGPEPIAVGRVTTRISDNVYAVAFDSVPTQAPVIEVGSRVYVQADVLDAAAAARGAAAGAAATAAAPAPPAPAPAASPSDPSVAKVGLVARVNGDGTFAVLQDEDDAFLPAVKRSQVIVSEGRPKYHQLEAYQRVADWVKSAGVTRKVEIESTASILYARGWREHKLYLLESADVHCLSHLNKSVRMGLLEKAEWERDHHRQRREWSKERLKETEWRYVITKYSSVVSVAVAFLGACSVFTWNLLRWRAEQRDYYVTVASEVLSKKALKPKPKRNVPIPRDAALADLVRHFKGMDVRHPRILVITGPRGCGKSTLCSMAVAEAGMAAVYVDVRGNEDPMRCILKALGVTKPEFVGDPLEFLEDSCREASKVLDGRANSGGLFGGSGSAPAASNNGTSERDTPTVQPEVAAESLPCLVLKVRDVQGGLAKVYSEAMSLACDRCICHVAVEVDSDSISQASVASLPRLEMHYVAPFEATEASQYVGHMVDPLLMDSFVQLFGTNSSELDELIGQIHQHGYQNADSLLAMRLSRAVRRVRQLIAAHPELKPALHQLCRHNFTVGAPATNSGSLLSVMTLLQASNCPAMVREMLFYDAAHDTIMFASKAFHTAAQVIL